jgi:hypothetical protein
MRFPALFLLTTALLSAQTVPALRPPATPLIACDPYFSVWSMADHLTDTPTAHWTGSLQPLTSLIRIDGKSWRLMGAGPREVAPLPQISLQVLPTRTLYDFEGAGVHVRLAFLTPTLPDDLAVLARPVTYLEWTAHSTDGAAHEVALYAEASGMLAVNTADQEVSAARLKLSGASVLRIGSVEQPMLKKKGDNLRIDWGHLYMAAPAGPDTADFFGESKPASAEFLSHGGLPADDDFDAARPVLAYRFGLGKVGPQPVSRYLLFAYDDQFSIEYLYRKLRPYWRYDGSDARDLIRVSLRDYAALKAKCERFDEQLMASLRSAGGEEYARLAALSYRQAFAGHKLAVDIDGTPMLFPKENFSNGCIATVDVIYPAAPILLLFNPELMKASLTPVLDYARSPRWRFPFAPHDLGTYPLANGQVYGGGEKTEENQMPVEESANMIILVDAVARADGNAQYAAKYWPLLERWAGYLKEKGLDPENQLCTDDFAGHLAHNANLSIKAIVALASYGDLCRRTGRAAEAAGYRTLAERYAQQWTKLAADGDHYRLAFDKPDTWSQKYNLVWDRMLGLNLFPAEVARKEIAFYKTKQNRYGLPLDNRSDYTKTDWLIWTATLAESREDFLALVHPIYSFLQETPDRAPLTDWYFTSTAKMRGFRARPVIGGVYIKMLAEKWKQSR